MGSSRKVEDDRNRLAQLGKDSGADVAAVGRDPPRRDRTELLAEPGSAVRRLAPFEKVAKTMRQRRDTILNAIEHGISNGRVEGFNTKVRLLIRRAYGFHSADAALALVMLAAGPVDLKLPHDRTTPNGRSVTHIIVRRAGNVTRRPRCKMGASTASAP